MSNEMQGIFFASHIDNEQLKKDAEEAIQVIQSIGKRASASSEQLDEAHKVVAGSIEGVKETMVELEEQIEVQNKVINELQESYDSLGQSASEAFMSHDDEVYRELIEMQKELETELNLEKKALEELEGTLAIATLKLEEYEEAIASAEEQISKLDGKESIFERLAGGKQRLKSISEMLPGPFKAATMGIYAMVKASLAFIATPLGAVITALVVAWKALSSWFNSSAEGQMAFTKGSAYLSGILGQLKEIVLDVGKWLYNAFSNPKEAIKELWQALKQNIINRVKGVAEMFQALGKIISNALKFNWDEVGQGAAELGDAFIKVTTGVENARDQLNDFIEKTAKAAHATAVLKLAQRQLEIDRSKWLVEEEKLNRRISDARLKSYDNSLTEKERVTALREAQQLIDQKYAKRLAFAKEELRIKEGLNALTTNDQADYNRVNELKAQVIRLETERNNEKMMISRRASGLEGKLSSEEARNIEHLKKLYQEMEHGIAQARINAMDEGLEKVLAQNELNFRKEMQQLEQQKKELQEAKGSELSNEDLARFSKLEEELARKLEEGNQKAYKQQLAGMEQYAQEYLSKVAEFNKNIERLQESGASEQVIAGVQKMQHEILEGLNEQMDIREEAFVDVVKTMVGMGLETLLEELETAKALLEEEQEKGNVSSENVTILKAQIAALKQQIQVQTKQQDRERKSSDELARYKNLLKGITELGKAADDIGDAFKDMNGDIFSVMRSIGNLASSIGSLLSSLLTLSTSIQGVIVGTSAASSTGITATSTAAAEGIKGVERASVILAIIGAALQILTAMAKMITNIFSKNKKREREIKRLQEQVDALKIAYENLGRAIDKAYSTDAAHLIKQQEQNLRMQKSLIEQQIQAEKRKKKTDKGKIKEWENQIREIDNMLDSTRDRQIEAIIGTDIKSAIAEFSEAYLNAWAAGEDKALAVKDVVRKMVKSAVTELVKSKLSPEVENFMSYLSNAMADGILSANEERMLDEFERRIMEKASTINQNFEKYLQSDKEREASKRGFASMSQESADELNGRFATLQLYTLGISENIKLLLINSQTILEHLSGIHRNTDRLESIEQNISLMRENLNDINLKGIHLKS